MKPAILVFNCGSSSIKFAVYRTDGASIEREASGSIDDPEGRATFKLNGLAPGEHAPLPPVRLASDDGMAKYRAALASLIAWLDKHLAGVPLLAAGHRVVHGGEQFAHPQLVDEKVLDALHVLSPLAPLHQERDLAPIHMLRDLLPELPQIACFDTAFHATQAPVARAFGLPRQLSRQGVKRYGFHGLSYQYIADRLPEYLGVKSRGRIVVAHLGSGASLCAMRDRKSVATTMGFSALDGLLMGTRGGALDPGVVLFLQDHHGMDLQTVSDMLYHRSGLLGVSGISSSMLELIESREPQAREAVDLFIYRFRLELGAMAAALGGLEALVFTGGIGQNSSAVRSLACASSRWLGVEIDEAANGAGGPRISTAASRVSVWAIPTDEEYMIAEHALAAVS